MRTTDNPTIALLVGVNPPIKEKRTAQEQNPESQKVRGESIHEKPLHDLESQRREKTPDQLDQYIPALGADRPKQATLG